MGFSWHLSTFALRGPPATCRGKAKVGKSVLHCESGLLLKVCGSAMKFVELDQHPSTACAGLFRATLRRWGAFELSAFTASTHFAKVAQAVSNGTGLPRHMTWLSEFPFTSRSLSRAAKRMGIRTT